ncbi:hypothetical protein [Thiohalophilus sp.]|uniref:hypothetical protein n=1 Tax=Thiohalophilus sp. TaxID=3028392 RepID=UPI002ACD77B8|nr:hypothetical protein [Thiohalophilus sp.]MDZ7804084.1 hypothetical protein [Thiohalophilus sp.]
MFSSLPSLLLYPLDPDYRPADPPALIELLQQSGLIGDTLEDLPGERYQAGPAFLQHISFLGCSPAVEFEPQAPGSDQFCHVGLRYSEQLQFRGGPQQVQVYCRQCRHREENWADIIDAWQVDPDRYRYSCPRCGAESAATELNWRKSGAFARLFIELYNIYPHEAVPTDGILKRLRDATGVDWKYIYVR